MLFYRYPVHLLYSSLIRRDAFLGRSKHYSHALKRSSHVMNVPFLSISLALSLYLIATLSFPLLLLKAQVSYPSHSFLSLFSKIIPLPLHYSFLLSYVTEGRLGLGFLTRRQRQISHLKIFIVFPLKHLDVSVYKVNNCILKYI